MMVLEPLFSALRRMRSSADRSRTVERGVSWYFGSAAAASTFGAVVVVVGVEGLGELGGLGILGGLDGLVLSCSLVVLRLVRQMREELVVSKSVVLADFFAAFAALF